MHDSPLAEMPRQRPFMAEIGGADACGRFGKSPR